MNLGRIADEHRTSSGIIKGIVQVLYSYSTSLNTNSAIAESHIAHSPCNVADGAVMQADAPSAQSRPNILLLERTSFFFPSHLTLFFLALSASFDC